MSTPHYSSESSGPATDQQGNPVIDPTKNVLDLVLAAVKRIDDLSTLAFMRQDDLRSMESSHLRDLITLRATERANDVAHLRQLEDLRAGYQSELRSAESERIDAIRAVDVQAAQQGRLEVETRARALEAAVAAAAEAMRNQVASAATAAATALANALDPIQKDIADLRRAQYEAQGVKAQTTESRDASGMWVGLAIAAVGLMIAFTSVVASIYIATH